MSRDVEELDVPDSPFVWLAVSARNYSDADDALWRIKNAIQRQGVPASTGQLQHLDVLRERRKAAYSDLITWAMACEAERLRTPAGGGR